MLPIATIGTCEHCRNSFVSNRYPTQEVKRFCSPNCRQAAYKRIPWVREVENLKRRNRRRKAKDMLKRKRLQELLEVMQKEVPV